MSLAAQLWRRRQREGGRDRGGDQHEGEATCQPQRGLPEYRQQDSWLSQKEFQLARSRDRSEGSRTGQDILTREKVQIYYRREILSRERKSKFYSWYFIKRKNVPFPVFRLIQGYSSALQKHIYDTNRDRLGWGTIHYCRKGVENIGQSNNLLWPYKQAYEVGS